MKNPNLKFSIVIAVLSFSFLFSCNEDDNVLPPISMVGSNTFGCYVNGELWLPKGRGGGSLPVSVDMSVDNFLAVLAGNRDSGIHLVINDSTGIQTNKNYMLNNHPYHYSTYYKIEEGLACDYDNVVSGSMTISKLEHNIVSGTFEFTSFNPECGDTLKVTEGRFDIGKIAY